MPAPALRPRSVTELLDAAFQLYRAHFGPFALLGAIMLLPFVAIGVLAVVMIVPLMPQAGAAMETMDLRPFLWMYALMPFALVWFALSDAALEIAASDAYLRDEVAVRGAIRQALRRGWRIVGATLLKFLAFVTAFVIGAIAAGIVAGIASTIHALLGGLAALAFVALFPYLYARLALVPATCVLEDSGATRAVERTISLSAGNGWRIAGGLLVVYLVLVVVQFTLLFGVAAMGLPIAGQVLGQLLWIAGYPIVAVLTMLFYYDLRIRKEGFDVEFMAAELAGTTPAAPPMGASEARTFR